MAYAESINPNQLKYFKIGDNYWTVGDQNTLQQISQSDITGRTGDLPAGTNAFDYLAKSGSYAELDPTKLSVYDPTNGETGYQVLRYGTQDVSGGGSTAFIRNSGTLSALGLPTTTAVPTGDVTMNQDFADYLKDTGQTYTNGQFSGNPDQGIMGTAATLEGQALGTVNSYGQPTGTEFVDAGNLREVARQAQLPQTTQTQQTQQSQIPQGAKVFQIDGKAYYSPTGVGYDMVEFNPQQYGIDVNSLGQGIGNAMTYGGAGGTGGVSPTSLNLAGQGAVVTSQLPQERDAEYKALESRLTMADDLISRIMASSMPTEREGALQKQLDDTMSSAQAGLNKIEGQSIAMPLLIGQQALLEKQANQKISAIQRELQRLSGNREAQAKMLEKAYDLRRQSITDALSLYQATSPEKLYFDEKSGTMYFQNPLTGEVTYQKLPGFTTPLESEDKPTTAAITEYEYARSQGYKGSYLDYQAYKARQYGTEGGGGGGSTADQDKRDAAFEKYVQDLAAKVYAGTYSREDATAQLRTLYPEYDENVIYDMVPDNYKPTSARAV